jgi:cytochrome c-type biogenesis protein CcmE
VGSIKFWIAGGVILLAAGYLIVSSTLNSARYYVTVAELHEMGETAQGRSLTVSGAVLGASVYEDEAQGWVTFTLVNIPSDDQEIEAQGGLEAALHAAVVDAGASRLDVVYMGGMPEMLRDEAQAICRGMLGTDGRFYAEEILLKCPSRYQSRPTAGAEGAG